jgi:hypothetical protein
MVTDIPLRASWRGNHTSRSDRHVASRHASLAASAPRDDSFFNSVTDNALPKFFWPQKIGDAQRIHVPDLQRFSRAESEGKLSGN